MTRQTPSILHRAAASIRRTYADMDRISRAMMDAKVEPRRTPRP